MNYVRYQDTFQLWQTQSDGPLYRRTGNVNGWKGTWKRIWDDANNIGFTPVQQGGGYQQLSNKIHIGWSGGALKAQVDATDMGNIITDGSANGAITPRSKGGWGAAVPDVYSMFNIMGIHPRRGDQAVGTSGVNITFDPVLPGIPQLVTAMPTGHNPDHSATISNLSAHGMSIIASHSNTRVRWCVVYFSGWPDGTT